MKNTQNYSFHLAATDVVKLGCLKNETICSACHLQSNIFKLKVDFSGRRSSVELQALEGHSVENVMKYFLTPS
jgi:hypothetical protein